MANEPTLLFGTEGDDCGQSTLEGCESITFTVTDEPIIIRAWGLEDDDLIFLEMVAGENEGELYERIKAGCGCSVALSGCNNTMVVSASGRYRLNRCPCPDEDGGDEPISPLAHIEFQTITTGAVVNYGDTHMACGRETGSEVSVVQPGDGSTIITVDGAPFIISAHPDPSPVVTAADLGDTIVLTVDGVPHQIDKGPDTFATLIATLGFRDCDGTVLLQNAQLATCDNMDDAIQAEADRIDAVVAALPDVRLQMYQAYNPATNVLTLEMSDGSTVDIPMTDLIGDVVAETIAAATVPLEDAFGVPLGNIFP